MLASDQVFCFIGLTVCLGAGLVFALHEIEATLQRKQHRKWLLRNAMQSVVTAAEDNERGTV